jgi:resolvase-like protein
MRRRHSRHQPSEPFLLRRHAAALKLPLASNRFLSWRQEETGAERSQIGAGPPRDPHVNWARSGAIWPATTRKTQNQGVAPREILLPNRRHRQQVWATPMLLGYARVWKADDQDTAAQVTALKEAGCTRVYEEKASGGRWDPRRALGHLLGNGVRFGAAADISAAGEGVETMLALKSVLPALPMIAALSANHLAALDLPPDRGRGKLCAASMSPATTTRPVSERRNGCMNAASPPASKSATWCRCMATSTSTSSVSVPRACSRISRISSPPPTGRAFCPIHAAPIRGDESQGHPGSFGAAPEGRRAFRLR